MSSQSYYKDRLGFDPREAFYETNVSNSGKTNNSSFEERNTPQRAFNSPGHQSDRNATPAKKAKQSQGGYEDALTQFKDERDAIQKKTFTKWVNKHLKKASRKVDDLFEDLRDGDSLLSLLEVLSGEHLPREKGKMRFHMLQNAQMALDFLRYKKIKLVNIRAEDIVDGNPKLTLGLIWTIILHFQISDIVVGKEENVTAREALLRWAARSTSRYPGVRVNDFTSSWRDGLAFSALVHRNRPDLLDWRNSRSARVRERLETVFHVVEREYGVTRLLDPEDVDTNEPDEKSLITYISSLYDVFPEPPSIHPLYDVDSQRRVHEYKELAQHFINWCREKTSLLQERSFPVSIVEMKRLLSDLNRLKSEEVPVKKREKTMLIQVYKDLERYFESVGEIEVEKDLGPETIETVWYRLHTALADQDRILQQEIDRLDRLQRLADKIQRETKHIDSKLSDLESRVIEDTRRIERLHPVDAKNVVERLETEIRHLEEPILVLNEDCNILQESSYPLSNELQKKVSQLQHRWSQLRNMFHANLVQKLSSLRYPVHETTLTRQTRTVVEARQIDTNPYFRDLQEFTEWCQNKIKQLLAADYGSDLPTVKAELENHQKEHRLIDQFHSKVLHAERQQTNFSGDESKLYQQRLSQLQKLYAELLSTSTKRLSDLGSLHHFLSQASTELQWLCEREQVEVSRDWADKNLDLPSIHRYYENLMSELEKREVHFATILDRGEALLVEQHPASKCIEAHLQALQQQWSRLLQLTLCLEVHLKHATESHQFFTEIKDAEQWLVKRDELLNTKYTQSDFGLDDGEALLRGMQDLREELNVFGETVQLLQSRAQAIVPLKQRKKPLNRETTGQAICSYKQQGNVSLEKGESCTIVDTSGRIKWHVRNSKGVEGSVPGAYFLLEPPDQEAIEAADRLKRLFDRSVALWQKKQLRLRQNMIFATIKVVKGWDFDQFLAMGPEQRTAIRRALNDDAEKLLNEGDPNDPQLRRLRREMDEVNRLFNDFERRAKAEEDSKEASRTFTEQCLSIKTKLENMARELDHIILSPLPRDLDSVEHVVKVHDDYQRRLNLLEPELNVLRETFRTIALKTPALKKSLDNLLDLWKELNTQSNLHADRLKLLEKSLIGLEDNEQVISELEGALAKNHNLPSNIEGLRNIFEQLSAMQDIITQQQPQVDKMNDFADQLGRMGVPTKVLGDLKRLHANVERLNTRWSTVCAQLADRLRSCETAIGLLKNLQTSIQVEETWVNDTAEKLSAIPSATSALELDRMQNLFVASIDHKPAIEHVNLLGGRLIREAKIYDGKCLHYIDWLSDVRPSFSPPRYDRCLHDDGTGTAEAVYIHRLDSLNEKYGSLLRNLAECLQSAGTDRHVESLKNAEWLLKPLRTYRMEFTMGNSGDDKSHHQNVVVEENSDKTKISHSSVIFVGHASRKDNDLTSFEQPRKINSDNADDTVQLCKSNDNTTPISQSQENSGSVVTHCQGSSHGIASNSTRFGFGDQPTEEASPGESYDQQTRLNHATNNIPAIVSPNSLQSDDAAVLLDRSLNFLQVLEKGCIEAENRFETGEKLIKQAAFEKFNICEATLSGFLKWIEDVELKIAKIGSPKEKPNELRSQINSLKEIKADIDVQLRPISSCLDQLKQLVVTGSDVLSSPEIGSVESSGRELRVRVDKALERVTLLLKKLEAANDELIKLRSELDIFSGWLQSARRVLEEKENSLSDLGRLSAKSESIRDFVSDVIAHQADLRFITMAAQKFFDESKEYLQKLNDFRTSLPDRLPHIMALNSSESLIRQEVSLVSANYKDLLHRTNALSDRLFGVVGKQREYQNAVDKAKDWLRSVQPRVSKILADSIAADPQLVEDQLNEARSLTNEFLSQERLLDNAGQALDALLKNLAGQISPAEISSLEVPVEELKDKYHQSRDALTARCKLLDAALVQSQGVQNTLNTLMDWINQAESKFKIQFRPASLIKERLAEHLREHRGLIIDLQSHKASIDSVAASGHDLTLNASNTRLAKKLENQLHDVTSRYEKLIDKSIKRGEFLEDVMSRLTKFIQDSDSVEQDLRILHELLHGKDLNKSSVEDFANRIAELVRRKDQLRPAFDTCIDTGKELISLRDVTDTGPVRDKIKVLENKWKSLETAVDEKTELFKQKTEHLKQYENIRDQVLLWLSSIEARIDALSPIAVDLEKVRQQIDELKPITKEYKDYAAKVDKINDLGAQYDSLIRSESPAGKRSTYSPIKHASTTRRMSGEVRSSSPPKGIQISSTVSPLSPTSSGFGSRRSSHDGFQITDTTLTQQQLNEINNRYYLIGVRLSDRQNELDSLRDEIKKHLENLKILSDFLDKVQRQIPKESVGSKEAAEQCTKQSRKILEDMFEKQNLLDSTKAQIKELLKRKPNASGAEKFQLSLDTVVNRWKAIMNLLRNRINFSEQLHDFLDTHDSLNNWLNSKERMTTVLGPITSDPRMVQSQAQQVQVLREEFRTQQPQLSHFQDVGHSILDQLKESTPEGQAINKKIDRIQSQWNDLVNRLDDRGRSLGAAADTSKEFEAGLCRLRESLQNISDNLDALPNDGDYQENLRKIENLERQLEGQRPLLTDAEQAASALCKVLSDPASRVDVNNQVSALGKQYQTLQKKLDTRKAETEGAVRDARQFSENCSKTLGWLSSELGNFSERLLVSAHKPTLQYQIDTLEPIYREIMAREHEIIMLLNKGSDLLQRSITTPDRGIQRDLDRIQHQWEKLKRDAVDRHTRLQTCMEHCKKYCQASDAFVTWLRNAEEKLVSLRPGLIDKSELDQRLRELQSFRSDIWKHSGEYENTKSLADTFLAACDIEKEPIKAEMQDIRNRWEQLNNDLLSRAQEVEAYSTRLGDFNENLRNLDHSVGRCEDRLGAHDLLGGSGKDPKLLEQVKAIREDVTNLKKPLYSLRAFANDIVSDARSAGVKAEHLSNKVDEVSDRMEDLQSRLDNRCGELQSAATAVSQFNEQIKNLGIDLASLEVLLNNLSPPAREIKIVQSQIRDTVNFLDKIDKTAEALSEAERSGETLIDSDISAREKIAGLKKSLNHIENRAREHDASLQSVLKALQQFYESHRGALDNIKDASDELRKMKPIRPELEHIRQQQTDFRRFQSTAIEPLSQEIEKVNAVGRDLVRSSQSGVSTAVIEKDLEKLNERWNELKDSLNERDRRLDVALLQSGKFREALHGLSKWLTDTEEMVANQKPPSSDYKVVKAQLQEQKFLKKMLLDRQNSMSSLFNLGQEVLGNCDPAEKTAVESQLKELINRFDALSDGAIARENDLEKAMEVAKRFQDKLIPLHNWLENAERVVKDMELIPTDEEKIQQKIREHDKFHHEILSKRADFTELADIAEQLMQWIGEEEAVNLGEKVQKTTEKYTSLVEKSDNIGELLSVSRKGLRHLVLTYQDLVAWMENMEKELQIYRIIPVHTDRLLDQMDHLVEINENVANHAPSVESTIEAGSDLMRYISSDEAMQLKDKLDSLQRRYGALTNKGGDLLKHAQEALPLIQQFHESHNILLDWMQASESVMATTDPRQDDILRLESELSEMRPVLESVNLVGPQLCQISPGEGAATIESLVTRDNRRFDAIVEQIQRKAERLHLNNQRIREVTGDIEELLEWFTEMDASLRDADPPALEPKQVRGQLHEHRSVNDDVSSQKGRARDVIASTKKVLRESSANENTAALREKLEDLKEIVDTVSQLCGNRLSILEQALPLSEHFADSYHGLGTWLDAIEHEISLLSLPALRPDQIALQQDKNERLLQSISEHKPLLDKLNKTGEVLSSLVAADDSRRIQDIVDSSNSRYTALRLELRKRQQALEQALQESSQFSDKLEGMLRALASTVDQVSQLDPVSALPQKIREQIEENAAIADDLSKRNEAFAAVQRAANDVILKASNQSDPAVQDIKKKLEKLNRVWNDVQKTTSNRGASLDETLACAEKFWKQLNAVLETLKDLEETLSSQELPAVQPREIKKQQVALQEIRHEIDQTKPEVEEVRRTGSNLMSMCGEPDKPEVKKHIEDLDHAWDNITALYAKREENLIDAMEKAMEFHETLQNLLKFLSHAEERFLQLGPIGSDIEGVKKQIDQLKHFKNDVDPHMVHIEALNRQALDLSERTSLEQSAAIRDPLSAVNRRWESLLRGMVDRQKQLEHALLHLGQFQHALNELLVWIDKTDETLDHLKPIPGDAQLLEVELAKLKVLANDIQAHQSSVDTLNDAGRQLIESEKGSAEASTTQEKLSKLNNRWKHLLQRSSDRKHDLEQALKEAQGFIAEVQDILGWLGDVDSVVGSSKPVGGLPETAKEQLERFMELFNELEDNRPKVETLQAQGQEYIKRQTQLKVPSSNLQHILRTLKQRWDAVLSRAADKKIKLEIAQKEATEFHASLQAFIEWLTLAEKQLGNAQPVSRVLETIQSQIEEHKVLQKDVSAQREAMLLLDKKGTHLKYFSQKQDVILIKNLLVSVQHRWERVVAKSAERTRALDHGYKEAREFHDAWSNLINWLNETESALDSLAEEAALSKDAPKIKKHLEKLKETQRSLSGKQSLFDTTIRTGKNLINKATKTDEPILTEMVTQLKETWSRVCSKSVERQRKLEEALLLSGQFSDALQALLDWLKKTKLKLSDQGPVHGDLETVTSLVDQHNNLEQDVQKRAVQMQSVLKTGKDLEQSEDSRKISNTLKELQELWEDVETLNVKRRARLQEALQAAEDLHRSVHMLMEWLSEAEQKLRYAHLPSDDESSAREFLELHNIFMRELRDKEHDKNETIHLAQTILSKAHPDAIPIIKNWITIIQTRWDEVSQWAAGRESKLKSQLQSLKDLDNSIEELISWLAGLEATLISLEREPLPDDILAVQELIADHKQFMENAASRQPEVDRVCKPKQPLAGTKEARKPSRATISTIRGSPSRDVNTPEKDSLPRYGPRFSPSNVQDNDTEFRSPLAKSLWDKWRYVWMLTWERQRRLHEHLIHLQDLERVRQFSWDVWRKRFLKFMNHKKSRLTDLFRKMDKDNNGLIPRDVFIDGIINTKFDTSRLEMGAVADLFDHNNEGLIDWQEFIAALRPDWQERKPATDSDKIHDEVKRLVMLCTCRQKFRVFQVGEGKYRFGDSQKLRLVRILRSTVMVRVGGGWVALDEFLQKNDPCRVDEHLAELMPIFERLRAQEQIPCAYPLHMGAGGTVFVRSSNSRSVPLSPHAPHCHPSTHWVRERSQRSVAMSRPSRSSLSASTPDSLSDNECNLEVSGRYTPRKPSYTRTPGLTPGGSRSGSKPNSRPLSRQGSKPPSQHGSSLSLDSTDEAGASRIPQRRPTTLSTQTTSATLVERSTPGYLTRLSRPSVGSAAVRTNTTGVQRKIASGSASPVAQRKTFSGTSTPTGSQTPRKGSVDPQLGSLPRKSRGTTPINQREPFRL